MTACHQLSCVEYARTTSTTTTVLRSGSQLVPSSLVVLVVRVIVPISHTLNTETRSPSIGFTGFSTTHFRHHTNKWIRRLSIIINLLTLFVFYHHYVACLVPVVRPLLHYRGSAGHFFNMGTFFDPLSVMVPIIVLWCPSIVMRHRVLM